MQSACSPLNSLTKLIELSICYNSLSLGGCIREPSSKINQPLFQLIVGLVVITSLLVVPSRPFAPTVTYAATLKDLNQQQLLDEKKKLQDAIDQKKREAAEKEKLAAQKKEEQRQYEAAAAKLSGDIKTTEGRIRSTEGDIKSTGEAVEGEKQKIITKEQEIRSKKGQINETLVDYAIALDHGSPLFVLLSSDRISTAIDRTNALEALTSRLSDQADDLDRQRQSLLASKARLEQQQQDLEAKKRQLAAYQRALDDQRSQKEKLADQSEEAKKKFLAEADTAKKISEELKKQFAAIVNEEAARRRKTSTRTVASASRASNPSSLGYVWPTDGVITTNFGGQTPFQNFHTGLDIANVAGTPVVAAYSGVVKTVTVMCCTSTGASYGYGLYIEILGDDGRATRYAHLLEALVEPGQRVARGQLIAYMGGLAGHPNSGWSTGPHLHFEVRDSQGADNPAKYMP